METIPPEVWWGDRALSTGRPPTSRSIVELVRDGAIDAALAGLLWALLENRLPVVVAGPPESGRTTLLTALLDFLPAGPRVAVPTADDEAIAAIDAARAGDVILVPELLRGGGGIAQRGALARAVVRGLGRGTGLATTMAGERLEDVFARLRGPAAAIPDDQLSFLGLVLVTGRPDAIDAEAPTAPIDAEAPTAPIDGGHPRVVAAHYVRPIARDAHGHLQRLGPAVLATWNPADARFEHFAWGIYPELAVRAGLRPGDLEREHVRRAEYLAGLAAAGVVEPGAVRAAIDGDRHARTHPPS